MTKRTLIQGVGINDADYEYRRQEKVDGKYKIIYQCKIHSMWKDLLRRCYNQQYKAKYLHYQDVTCCEDWLVFSKFKEWIDSQGDLLDKDGRVKHLDKDLLNMNNKHYSPENCIVVSRKINNFFLEGLPNKETKVRGVCYNKKVRKYQVFCKDPLNRYSKYIGNVVTVEEGNVLYRTTKLKYFRDLYHEGYVDTTYFYKICDTWFPELYRLKFEDN